MEPPAPPGERRLRVKAAEGKKWCSACQTEKGLASFKSGAYCIPCTRSKGAAYRLKTVYNLSVEQYQAILDHQGGRCAICGMKPRTKKLAVDHDHATNLVRGLLCTVCNSGVLAMAKDRAEILRAAADYLDSPPAIQAIGEVQASEQANVKRRPRRRGRGSSPWLKKGPSL
ncbi:endonuclease VII domain-containing protein [Dactylosporangium sp. CA-139066]|uniref:endonuclease VII domain-containing protein n=1 Tax=Dactylosporangium sp. CA-139066 TaxID=3239930 RepID=UPI003D8EFE1B